MNEFRACALAEVAHAGQRCKITGEPYAEHLRRVAERVDFHDPDAVTVAWLHDIVEDTPISIEDLQKMGFPPRAIDAIKLLTKDETLTYEQNIERIIASGNQLAVNVKIADVRDHLRPETLGVLPIRMLKKYVPALARLEEFGA